MRSNFPQGSWRELVHASCPFPAMTASVRVLATCVLLAGSIATTPASAQFIRGDVDGDDFVTQADAVLLADMLYGTPSASFGQLLACDACDANDNGPVSIGDVSWIARFANSGGPPPPAPFPTQGFDPTPGQTFIPSFGISLSMGIEEVTACPGSTIGVPVTLSTPEPLAGFQLCVEFDPFALDVTGLDLAPLVALLPGGVAPDLAAVTPVSDEVGVVRIGVLGSYTDPAVVLPSLNATPVLELIVDVHPSIALGDFLPIQIRTVPQLPPADQRHLAVLATGEPRSTTVAGPGGVLVDCPFATLPFLRGDTNDDGSVGVSDVTSLVSHLFGGGPGSACERSGDANDDGVVDIADVVRLISLLFLSAPPLAEPFPACGVQASAAGPAGCSAAGGGCP